MAMPATLGTGEITLDNMGHGVKNSCCRLQNVKGLYSALGCNVALLEYRGYGRSEGSPSEVRLVLFIAFRELISMKTFFKCKGGSLLLSSTGSYLKSH